MLSYLSDCDYFQVSKNVLLLIHGQPIKFEYGIDMDNTESYDFESRKDSEYHTYYKHQT